MRRFAPRRGLLSHRLWDLLEQYIRWNYQREIDLDSNIRGDSARVRNTTPSNVGDGICGLIPLCGLGQLSFGRVGSGELAVG